MPGRRRGSSESFGSHPRRPRRRRGRTAATAAPPCSHPEAVKWLPELLPAADPLESLHEERVYYFPEATLYKFLFMASFSDYRKSHVREVNESGNMNMQG